MKIMIAAVFYFLYWGVCFLGTGTDRKNLIGLRSYPDEVQTRVQSDPQLGQAVPKAKSTAAILLSNLLLFTVVFSVLGLALKSVLGLNNYLSAFLVLPCIRRGIGPVRSPCDRSALVAQYKTHPFLVFAGEEILSGSEKAYRIVLARYPVVCRSCRTGSLDRYRALKQYMGDAPRCMASSNTPTRECNDLPYLRT